MNATKKPAAVGAATSSYTKNIREDISIYIIPDICGNVKEGFYESHKT